MGRLKNRTPIKALSRRAFLRNGAIVVGLPFLDAMIPTYSFAQAAAVKRFITTLQGSVVGKMADSVPAAFGPLTAPLGMSWTPLENLKTDISIVSNIILPVYPTGSTPPPGGSQSGQHGFSRGPMLSGMTSSDAMTIPQACQTSNRKGGPTSDQIAIDIVGNGSKFDSLQIKCQAYNYNGRAGIGNNGKMSARLVNGVIVDRLPVVSPLELYNNLFGASTTPPASTNPGATPAQQLAMKKSVLDAVLGDAKRLSDSLSGEDKVRLELHFEEIRKLEKAIAASGSSPAPPSTATCTKPAAFTDPPLGSLNFGGWSGELVRGQLQADLIAFAIGCDLTRVVSWMLSNDQCFLNSKMTSNSSFVDTTGLPDVHRDSHFATSDIQALNNAWHVALWARLIGNLKTRMDANGPILNNTFLSYVTCEGHSAHSRSFTQVVAGMGARVNLGQHIDGKASHAAKLQIAGLQAVGSTSNSLGQITTGPIVGLLK